MTSDDVAVIPHKVNELTRNMNPIKLREFLAAGLPVVASKLPEVKVYEPYVRTAEGVDDWLQALEEAMSDRSATADRCRSELVAGEDWTVRVQAIGEALDMVIAQRYANDTPVGQTRIQAQTKIGTSVS